MAFLVEDITRVEGTSESFVLPNAVSIDIIVHTTGHAPVVIGIFFPGRNGEIVDIDLGDVGVDVQPDVVADSLKTLGSGIRVNIVQIWNIVVVIACQGEILARIVGRSGSGPEFVNGAWIPCGRFVEADQKVAGTVIMEDAVQVEGHPAGTRGSESALPHLVGLTHLYPIVVVLETAFTDVLHIDLDTTQGE